jgi:hypothetical protein
MPIPAEKYTTRLSESEKKEYESWKKTLPKRLQYEEDYDLSGLWKSDPKIKPSENLHFPDKFKKPNHPTFSDESVYFNKDTQKFAGKWEETPTAWIYMPYDNKVKRKIIEMKQSP